MMNQVHRCKITVIKRTLNKDLIEKYLEEECQSLSICECFYEGQVFEVDLAKTSNAFGDLCPRAWIDIYNDVSIIAYGGDIPGYREKGIVVSSCADWFRPVFFRIERV